MLQILASVLMIATGQRPHLASDARRPARRRD